MNFNNTTPIKKSERIHELDIFRGFAIFGIFMVNILVMNVSFAHRMDWEAEQTGWLQRASLFVLETVFYGKFFTIFSFLFGIGVALQIQRLREKGIYSSVFFFRRFGSLFLFGVLHILFIWSGDILHLYGMLGFLLLLFFKLSPRLLLLSSITIFFFPFYSLIFQQFIDWIGFDYAKPLASLSRSEILELKHHGSYYSGILLRLKEYSFVLKMVFAGIVPTALSMMLLGGYFVKKGGLENINNWIWKTGKYLLISLAILLVFRFSFLFWIMPTFKISFGSSISITLSTFYLLSDIAISLSLLWIIAFLWNKNILKSLLSPLQYVGRMGFSNYIFQSITGYLIMRTFNGYEYFTPFECILLVIGIYFIQIVFSKLWLKSFKFGPLEWIWRCISYMKLLPIRKM